jgi:phage baseplate assembly protein W
MTLQGSWLVHPIQPDQRGTTATVSDRVEMVRQSITAIIETRQGERVMVPEYGIPDVVFSVIGIGLAASLAYHVKRQIRKYEPLVDALRVRVGSMIDGRFVPGVGDEQRIMLFVEFTVRGSNTPFNLVFPTWEFVA